MSAAVLLRDAVLRLREAEVEDPARDARRLLAWAAGVDAAGLIALDDAALTDAVRNRFAEAIAARVQRCPVSHITGMREFWGRPFRVTGDVLDPRPETEILIAEALKRPAERVLDLGTGSGCLLLTLLAEWPRATGLGTDVSEAALAVARGNALALGLGRRAAFQQADWLDGVEGAFDLIVSNPPYIAAAEMPGLSPEVRLWEPHGALSPGGDGLDAYRAIAAQAGRALAPGGRLMLEIGASQAVSISAILSDAGWQPAPPVADFDGRDRVIVAGR